MEQQQKMSLILSDFIGNASSGGATSVWGKGSEVQQQCRPIPDEFPHQKSGKAVLVQINFSTSSTQESGELAVATYGEKRFLKSAITAALWSGV